MENKDYYVYVHKVKDGDIFYVGQGKGNRYKHIYDKSSEWQKVYNNNKCEVLKVKDNLTREESLILEAELILKYGRKLYRMQYIA